MIFLSYKEERGELDVVNFVFRDITEKKDFSLSGFLGEFW